MVCTDCNYSGCDGYECGCWCHNQKHRNSETQCQGCGERIYFSIEHLSKSGKYIPLDYLSRQPHQCEAAEPTRCRTCGHYIIFIEDPNDPDRKIPTELDEVTRHSCARKIIEDMKRDFQRSGGDVNTSRPAQEVNRKT